MRRSTVLMGAGIGAGLIGARLLRRAWEADLAGQVVLISGSSRGLGFLLAREFARNGCRLVINSRNAAELDRARRDLERGGAEVFGVAADFTDPEQVREGVYQARRRFGDIDILVNNLGTIQVGPFQSMTVQDFEEALKVMFWGVVHPTLAVLPEMLARRSGRIVNITSIGGKVSVPHLLPYNCAKFAAVGFSEGLRAELGKDGVRVVTVVPGLMRTGSFLNAFFKGQQEREYRWFSLGAALPLVSMDAERAARQIVRATRRGEAVRILTMPANLIARFHGMFPGLTANLLSIADRLLLPSAEGGATGKARGMELHERAQSKVLNALTKMGLNAAARFNQYPGPVAA